MKKGQNAMTPTTCRQIRERLELSRKAMAEALGIGQSTLALYERPWHAGPPARIAKKLEAFNAGEPLPIIQTFPLPGETERTTRGTRYLIECLRKWPVGTKLIILRPHAPDPLRW